MATKKGANLEELVRTYFAQQGFFAIRGINLRFEDEIVTDIDVWLYGRQSASVRTRTVIDVKNKRSPKAFERILWTRGMQLALDCDKAIVATTYSNPKIIRFAREQNVELLHKDFLVRLQNKIDISGRFTIEQFVNLVNRYSDHKHDGDWLKQLADAKSALVSLHGYQAFNKSIAAFRFFAERVETRPQYKEQALRSAYLTAGLACIALDGALQQSLYEDTATRYQAIADGVTYGDSGSAKVQNSIKTVLDVISTGMENGRVVSQQAKDALNKLFKDIRADIIAEYFSREYNASSLFNVAKELDKCAFSKEKGQNQALSTEAKSVLGVFADFVQIKRNVLFPSGEIREGKLDTGIAVPVTASLWKNQD